MSESPDPIDLHVGQTVRATRINAGMTQAQLAEAIGVRFQQVQKYETGLNRFSASRLKRAADFLCVPVSHFFRGLEDGESGISCVFTDAAALRLASMIVKLPAHTREGIERMIDTISTNAA